MHKKSFILVLILICSGSCIKPLDINIDEEVNVLIVEGGITTKPGKQWIRLSRSAKYGSIFDGYIRPMARANVVIRDSDGVDFSLVEDIKGSGIYYTGSDFSATVGKSYTLLITTENGIEYTSLPEKIFKVEKIDGLSTVFSKTKIADNMYKTGLKVYAKFADNPDEHNYYWWKTTGTYQSTTSISGCCSMCWIEESKADNEIRLLNDININGNTVEAMAAFIEDDGMRFSTKYMVRIEQHTLTREAYQFFKLLRDQISINGDIFDPPPATLRGNMVNLTNPDENVIGYFSASDVSIDSMFLTPDMLLEVKPLLNIDGDCRKYKNGSTDRPPYW